jgi:hypothetical protein
MAGVVNDRPGVPESCCTSRNSPRSIRAIDLPSNVIDAPDRPFVHDGFPLKVAIARERDGVSRDVRRLTFLLRVMRTPELNSFNNL